MSGLVETFIVVETSSSRSTPVYLLAMLLALGSASVVGAGSGGLAPSSTLVLGCKRRLDTSAFSIGLYVISFETDVLLRLRSVNFLDKPWLRFRLDLHFNCTNFEFRL